jgi:hypothetical protein
MAHSPFASTLLTVPSTGQRPASSGSFASIHEGAGRERRTLVVGRGISLQGTVQDAERLVVEGPSFRSPMAVCSRVRLRWMRRK